MVHITKYEFVFSVYSTRKAGSVEKKQGKKWKEFQEKTEETHREGAYQRIFIHASEGANEW